MSAKILFVEDEIDLGSVVKQYLELKGFEVIWVQNGKDALDEFGSNSTYDLVLLDTQLPDINGFQVAESIKKYNADVFFFISYLTERKTR